MQNFVKLKFKDKKDLLVISRLLSNLDIISSKKNNFASSAILALLKEVVYLIGKKVYEGSDSNSNKCTLRLSMAQCYACLSVNSLIYTDHPHDYVVFNGFIAAIHSEVV